MVLEGYLGMPTLYLITFLNLDIFYFCAEYFIDNM